MKHKINLTVEVTAAQLRAAKQVADNHGEKSVRAMLKNFVETEMRNYAFDDQERRI